MASEKLTAPHDWLMENTIPPLNHGAIGNGRVLALIAPTTRIEWLCLPRFDSPSVFASLLDPDRGGSFSFERTDPGARMEMFYVANTNVLRTRVTASGRRLRCLGLRAPRAGRRHRRRADRDPSAPGAT